MSSMETIPEDEVTIESLRSLLDKAFYPSEVDDDGDIEVTIRGRRIYLDLRSSAQFIGYSAYFEVKEHVPLTERHALVNRLNDSMVMVRFSIGEQNPRFLLADYHLSFEGGIAMFQVIATLRAFEQVVAIAISTMDEEDIV